jgi:nucleoside-diphosphate kinase
LEASPGTIRGDMGITIDKNIIHGSDSLESANKEIALFFQPAEILNYQRNIDTWITES